VGEYGWFIRITCIVKLSGAGALPWVDGLQAGGIPQDGVGGYGRVARLTCIVRLYMSGWTASWRISSRRRKNLLSSQTHMHRQALRCQGSTMVDERGAGATAELIIVKLSAAGVFVRQAGRGVFEDVDKAGGWAGGVLQNMGKIQTD
jgi:hypothetical protein